MEPTRVILMACGSFNPPTNMHLRMFEIARDHLHRMGTHVIVGGVISPTHDSYGKKDLASAEHRCMMVKLALQNNDWIRVSTWESRQNNWTPTRICLQNHQNLLNSILLESADTNHIDSRDLEWIPEDVRNAVNRSPIKIKLLCGADLLESFGVPGLWAEDDIDAIVGEHGLVVITREGSNPNKFIYDSDILSKHMHNIYIVTEWICNEVSSTKIRRALKRGESVRYLIQDLVVDYIYAHGLYNVKTTINTKLSLSSNNSNNYLHIDEKYSSSLLTPSPSDIIMGSPSPVEIISIDINEAVIKKNIFNSPKSRLSIESNDNDRGNDKFLNVMSENGNKITPISSKSSYPGQAKQIIATETGESQIFREVGSQSTDASQQSTVNNHDDLDQAIQPSSCIEIHVSDENSVLTVESQPDCVVALSNIDSEPQEPQECLENTAIIVAEEVQRVKSPEFVDEPREMSLPLVTDTPESIEKVTNASSPASISEEQVERKPSITECQEPYEKVLQVRRSLKDSSPRGNDIDGKYLKSVVNSKKSPKRVTNLAEQVVPMMEESKATKIKKPRELVPKTESKKKNYQGSLDSINSRKPTALSKKSKSFEFIKCDLSLKEFKPAEEVITKKIGFIASKEQEHIYENQPIDELCSVCCYGKNGAVKSAETVRSTNSSPLDGDSANCEFCNQENEEVAPGEPECELCEICGDIAMEMDVVASSRPEAEELMEARLLGNTRHMPLKLSRDKRHSGRLTLDGRIFEIADEELDSDEPKIERPPSTSVEEYSADDSTLDDVEFEIENCGLDADTKPLSTRPFGSPDLLAEKSDPELEDALACSTKRMTRGSSMITRPTCRPESERRYSSVDNLPSSRFVAKTPNESIKVMTGSRKATAGSVDNIRVSRISKSPNKLRKSADDVAKQDKEMTEEGVETLTVEKNENSSRVEPDIIKFVISKHGLKIISDRETAL